MFIGFCFVPIVAAAAAGAFSPQAQELAFPSIALVFLIMGLGTGLLSGAGVRTSAGYFIRGLTDFAPAIVLVLLAAAVGYLMEVGLTMDPLLHRASGYIGRLSPPVAALGLYLFQVMMNFFVPSGTGQAVLTIPILAPLGDLVGVTRQTVVLAFQCGDGFSNLIWPTNPMLHIAVGLAGVSYRDWVRWVWPLQALLLVLCSCFLVTAALVKY
ncbi:MAG: TIGR00366 family protein [Pseudomonadota bacterium]